MELDELQIEFLEEASFLLEQCQESFLKLESGDSRDECLSEIFRIAHSLKGAGSAVGFQDLSEFAHKIEDLLSILRVYPNFVSQEIVSVLLESNDQLSKRVSSLQGGKGDAWDVKTTEEKMVKLIEKLDKKVEKGDLSESSSNEELSNPIETQVGGGEDMGEADQDGLFEELDSVVKKSIETQNDEGEVSEEEAEVVEVETKNEEIEEERVEEAPLEEKQPEKQESLDSSSDSGEKDSGKKQSQSSRSSAPKSSSNNQPSSPIKTKNSVKVSSELIDSVLNIVGELVVIKSQIIQNHEDIRSRGNRVSSSLVDMLDKRVRELHDKTLKMRLTSIKPLFLKLQRIARDLSIKLSKPIEMQVFGEETEIDRTMVEVLGDPLVHIIRNSIDHGVEDREKRLEKGKPEDANIVIEAYQSNGQVVIEVKDDGKGIDREKVLEKAAETGLLEKLKKNPESMSSSEVYELIMTNGFSTADQVTDVSGRGVGLDVVRTNIERIHGNIEIDSIQEKGTTFRIALPLTAAITEGMLVLIDGHRYILPTYSVREIIQISQSESVDVNREQKVIKVKGELYPLLSYETILRLPPVMKSCHDFINKTLERERNTEVRESDIVILVESRGRIYAICIERILGQNQFVIKPTGLDSEVLPGVSGAAILGDGDVALVLDIEALVKAVEGGERSRNKNVDAHPEYDSGGIAA